MTSDDTPGDGGTAARPLLRIVSGSPTPEEIAIVTAVLTTVGGTDEEPSGSRPLWSRPTMRRALANGPGGWRASGLRGL